MAQPDDAVTLDEVLKLAKRLSAVDKVRLIERGLTVGRGAQSHPLLGLLRDLGPAPSGGEIDAARREAWASFPRDEV